MRLRSYQASSSSILVIHAWSNAAKHRGPHIDCPWGSVLLSHTHPQSVKYGREPNGPQFLFSLCALLWDQAIRESVTVNNVYGDHMINSVLPNISNQQNNNDGTTITDSMQYNPYQQKETTVGPGTSSASNNETSANLNQNSLNKSLYHLQSLVYNPTIQSNLLSMFQIVKNNSKIIK